MSTQFAPRELADRAELKRQQDIMHKVPMLEVLLNAVPVAVLVLNTNRQIIYSNLTFLEFIETLGSSDPQGKRPGQVLRCVNAHNPDDCGTTEFCQTCGAVNAILKAQQGIGAMEECRIQTVDELEIDALDLRVWTTPFFHDNEPFTIFAVMDISDEKRRRALERIFFHDVMNQAGAVVGFAELLCMDEDLQGDERTRFMQQSARRLVEEVAAQRDLSAAESGDLHTRPQLVNSLTLAADVAGDYGNLPEAKGRILKVDRNAASVELTTDIRLLGRVLGNMVKNALEASKSGETVTIGVEDEGEAVCFWVHNEGLIPRKYQLELFKRSFSTKGDDRGLGTYSMKLLTERYLGGTVSYESTIDTGTRFDVRLPLQN